MRSQKESEPAKDTEFDSILKNNEIMNSIRILRKAVCQWELAIVNQIKKIEQAIFDDASKKTVQTKLDSLLDS